MRCQKTPPADNFEKYKIKHIPKHNVTQKVKSRVSKKTSIVKTVTTLLLLTDSRISSFQDENVGWD